MSTVIAPANAKNITIEAVVTRVDGTTEDLGVIGYWHKNPLMRALYRVKRLLGLV